MTRWLAIAIAAATIGAAHAEVGVPEKARQLAERGRQLHRDRQYGAAIEAYKAAYVLAPSPGLLFNLAQSYRLAGDCDDAAWMYRRYLESDPSDDMRTLARTHLDTVEKCAHGTLRVAIEPGTTPPTTIASAPERPPETPPPPVGDSPGRRPKQVGTWLVVGGGGALLIAGIAALDAANAASSVSDAYDHNKLTDVRALDDRGQRSATIATVLGIGGGIAVASGAVLYSIGRHLEQVANHVAVAPKPGGGTVSVSWGF